MTLCVIEMKLAVQAVWKNAIKEFDRNDLVAVVKSIAQFTGIHMQVAIAGSYRDDGRKAPKHYKSGIKFNSLIAG